MKTRTKEEAFDLFENHRAEFLSSARLMADMIYKSKGSVTTDDIRHSIDIPETINKKVLGCVFNTKEWVLVGYTKSKVKTSHGRTIGIFKKAIDIVND